ncbi:MAG: low molecular weight phosphotyrosine protein phosphatase [Lentisphaeraceae bacterium]|nr:low molecular weight phosphotyrosine protein phosphatase [Lentisphaeraceae bacterium]
MKKIMFVCLGNICRSPIAEAVFTHLTNERGVAKKYYADSSGTSAFHVGADPDPRMAVTAEKKGIMMDHKAQQFDKSHFEKFDIIFAMDKSNYDDIISMTQNAKLRKKVHLLREFDSEATSTQASVPDPYYRGGMSAFDDVYDIVSRSCSEVLDRLENGQL